MLALSRTMSLPVQTPDLGRRGLQWVVKTRGDVVQATACWAPDASHGALIEHRDGAGSGGFGGLGDSAG